MYRNLLISTATLSLFILLTAFMPASPALAADSGAKAKTFQPKHIVIVMEENHSYKQIIGSAKGKRKAPYMNHLAKIGANMTNSHGVWHPSQPNYIALFSGSRYGVKGDGYPKHRPWSYPNLGAQLIKNGFTFIGYSEDLPKVGYNKSGDGKKHGYRRKHSPWTNWQAKGKKPGVNQFPKSVNQPFTSFPKDFNKLPTVSFVIPTLAHDMHDGSINAADKWLKKNMSAYIKWAPEHDSLFILSWDEDNNSKKNHIPTIFIGAHVKTGNYDQLIDHYSVLWTIEKMYGLKRLAKYKDERYVNSFTKSQWKQNRKAITEIFDLPLGK